MKTKKEICIKLVSTDLLRLIDNEFNISSNLENYKLDELNDLIESVENINKKGYDYIYILDEGEYRVIPENIIDKIFREELKELASELDYMPENIKNYFDIDKFVSHCKMDGYGHHFNGYDGSEIEGNGFYLFRNN